MDDFEENEYCIQH